MKPVFVEVIAPVLTAYSHCQHCEVIFDRADVATKKHQMDMDEYPEDVKRDYARLCDWVAATAARYRGRIQIKITDPQSLEGVFKAFGRALSEAVTRDPRVKGVPSTKGRL